MFARLANMYNLCMSKDSFFGGNMSVKKITRMVLVSGVSIFPIVKMYMSIAEDGEPHPYWLVGCLAAVAFILISLH